MSQISAAKLASKSKGRSKVSNDEALLPGIDQRSATYRRYRDIATAIAVDCGGADRLSETRLQLIRRFSATCVMAELAELAKGEEIDPTAFCALASTTVRLAARIGLSRSPRNPSVLSPAPLSDWPHALG